MRHVRRVCAIAFFSCAAPAYAQIQDLPPALYRDAEPDGRYPATSRGIEFESHGSTANGTQPPAPRQSRG